MQLASVLHTMLRQSAAVVEWQFTTLTNQFKPLNRNLRNLIKSEANIIDCVYSSVNF